MTDVLTQFLSPLTPESFEDAYWEKKAVVLRGQPDRFQGIFSREALVRLLARRARHSRTSAGVVSVFRDADGEQHEFAIAPEIAVPLSSIMTVCLEGVERDSEPLSRLADGVRRQLCPADDVSLNCYMAPVEGGYAIHFDAMDVFVLQIDGERAWHFEQRPSFPLVSEPAIPIDGQAHLNGEPIEVPSVESLSMERLVPGDILYLPAGTWHRAKSVTPSVALSLNCCAFQVHRAVLSCLGRALRAEASYKRRVRLPRVPGSGPGVSSERDELQRNLAQLFDLAAGVSAEDVVAEALERTEQGK